MYDVLAMLYSIVIYLTIQYQWECGHIEGHAYSVLFVRNEYCVLEFHVYNYEFNNSLESCTLENIIPKYSKTSHADTFGAGPLSLLERLSYTKTNL